MQPLTYTEAAQMFKENGGRSFSFIVKPYTDVKKTVVVEGGNIVAAPATLYESALLPDFTNRRWRKENAHVFGGKVRC